MNLSKKWLMKEDLTIVLEADCSTQFYQSSIKLISKIKMEDVEIFD